MTERQTDQPISRLPEVRSPRELDDRILAHARANAPRASRTPVLAWGSGLGAVAVLVLALYVVKLEDAARTVSAPPIADPAELSAGDAATREASTKAAIAVQADMAAPERLEERQATATGSAEKSAAAPARPAPPLDAELEKLRTMVEAGQEEKARAAYADLRRRCVDCDLPARLEDALRNLPD